MLTTYSAVLSGNASAPIARNGFPTILDCVRWAERSELDADRCDIYGISGVSVAQYRRPQPGTYPAACGVWINAKIA